MIELVTQHMILFVWVILLSLRSSSFPLVVTTLILLTSLVTPPWHLRMWSVFFNFQLLLKEPTWSPVVSGTRRWCSPPADSSADCRLRGGPGPPLGGTTGSGSGFPSWSSCGTAMTGWTTAMSEVAYLNHYHCAIQLKWREWGGVVSISYFADSSKVYWVSN